MTNRYMPMLDLTGRKVGDLTVLEEQPRSESRGQRRWVCRCVCGRTTVVDQGALRERHTRSCGCRRTRANKARWTTHGKSESVEYAIWLNIKNRCYNKRGQNYGRYGGRGIRMSPTWRRSFATFLSDMGHRPAPRHQIDRIDNDGPYSRENCRWATPAENSNNRSSNRLIAHAGVTLNVRQWANRTGISYTALRLRLNRGWSVDRALTVPVRELHYR